MVQKSETVSKKVIAAFGGITATSKALGAPISTVHSWKSKGIPHWRKNDVIAAAARADVELPAEFKAA